MREAAALDGAPSEGTSGVGKKRRRPAEAGLVVGYLARVFVWTLTGASRWCTRRSPGSSGYQAS
jgi:hypothetical protein